MQHSLETVFKALPIGKQPLSAFSLDTSVPKFWLFDMQRVFAVYKGQNNSKQIILLIYRSQSLATINNYELCREGCLQAVSSVAC